MGKITFNRVRRKIGSIVQRKIVTYRKQRLVSFVQKADFPYGLNQLERKEKIIISLTSYPPRFSSIGLVLKSLLLQTIKPDMIILWLGCGPEAITPEMHSFETYGISFRYWLPNYGPHDKYFFALQEFCDDIVITVDDDAIYPPDLVTSLLEAHHLYPGCICARKVHKITWDEHKTIRPYQQWHKKYKKTLLPSKDLVAIGVGGILYPPRSFSQMAFNPSLFSQLCPKQDDLWLKWMEMREGIDIVWAPNSLPDPPEAEGSQIVALNSFNVNGHGNDDAIAALSRYFGAITPDGFVPNQNTSR